ncbi:MAG: hypothetical protein ACRC9X_08225 [Bacteroidales bacterium]
MKTKNIFNVKTVLCAVMLAAVTLTSCKKDKGDDNTPEPQVLSMVQELKTKYLGKNPAEIKAAMEAIGYIGGGTNKDQTYMNIDLQKGETKSYQFTFDKAVTDASAKVAYAHYGVINTSDSDKREAYLSQFEVWGEECNDLGYNAEYIGAISDKSYPFTYKEFTERAAFKTDYNAKKGTLSRANENFSKDSNYAYSEFTANPYTVMVGVGIDDDSATSRSSRLTKRN